MYKITGNGIVIRVSDGAIIPDDADNTDYKEYLEWVELGNSPKNDGDCEATNYRLLREIAYRSESDPIFMEWKYDLSQEKEEQWRRKVAEIKARYPMKDVKSS